MESDELPAALDLLRAHGDLSERQHRKLIRAVERLDRPSGWFRRVPEIDRLGLLLLRGDIGETAFSVRLKVLTIQMSIFFAACMCLMGVGELILRDSPKQPLWEQSLVRAPLLLASASVWGILMYFACVFPLGRWWLRRFRRLEELQAQQDPPGTV